MTRDTINCWINIDQCRRKVLLKLTTDDKRDIILSNCNIGVTEVNVLLRRGKIRGIRRLKLTFVRATELTEADQHTTLEEDPDEYTQELSFKWWCCAKNNTQYNFFRIQFRHDFGVELLPLSEIKGIKNYGTHFEQEVVPAPRLVDGVSTPYKNYVRFKITDYELIADTRLKIDELSKAGMYL
jgi:hypothetical protein